jgi:hypothetical protein
MNFEKLLTTITEIDKPITQLREVNEHKLTTTDQDMKAIKQFAGLTESAVAECGMPMGGMSRPPETPVTMNVSVNATGTENIRDLLDILKGTDFNGSDDAMKGPAGLVLDVERDDGEPNMRRGGDADIEIGEENLANAPDEMYADVDAVIPTGDDLHSHGGNEAPKVNGGGNPYTAVSENLKLNLQNLYNEVKSR